MLKHCRLCWKLQGRFAAQPAGGLYMGAELSEKPKWGLVTQTMSSVVMRFASQLVKTLHYSFGDKRAPADAGDAELMHATFPLFQVCLWWLQNVLLHFHC
jgi:Protein of unknown function (DUF1769)